MSLLLLFLLILYYFRLDSKNISKKFKNNLFSVRSANPLALSNSANLTKPSSWSDKIEELRGFLLASIYMAVSYESSGFISD